MGDLPIPLTHDEVTPEWLTAALRSGGALNAARIVEIAAETIGEGVGFVGDIARLRLSYDEQEACAPATIIAKLPTMEPRRRMMGAAARFFEREIRFYRDIAPGIDVRTPRCHYGASSPGDGRHVLLLEDLAPAEPGDQLRILQAGGGGGPYVVMGCTASAMNWRRSTDTAAGGRASVAEAWWDEMWKRCVERAGGCMPAAALRTRTARRKRDVGAAAAPAGPTRSCTATTARQTCSSAETAREPASSTALSTRGCGVYDLAYLLPGSGAADRKSEMALIRAAQRAAGAARGYSQEEAVRDYRLSGDRA
jgi:hypothetical protein